MAKSKKKQVRVGTNEQKIINSLKRKISNYKIFSTNRKDRETDFNKQLMHYLLQKNTLIELSNRDFPKTLLVEETFRPEFYLSNLFAVECKLLRDNNAKSKWKEGLSQSFMYTLTYKVVFLVLFDFTTGSKYEKAFGKKNSIENQFAEKIKKNNNLHVIVLKPSLK